MIEIKNTESIQNDEKGMVGQKEKETLEQRLINLETFVSKINLHEDGSVSWNRVD